MYFLHPVPVANRTTCTIRSPLMVNPFSLNMGYNFRSACEHILVEPCDVDIDFAVVVDFLDDLESGRIGIRYEGRLYIHGKGGDIGSSETPIVQILDTRYEFPDGTIVTKVGDRVTAEFPSLQVTVIASPSEFQVGVGATSPLARTCGLCGTPRGMLLYSDRVRVANIMDMEQVMEFTDSYLVPPRYQILRGIRRECGE